MLSSNIMQYWGGNASVLNVHSQTMKNWKEVTLSLTHEKSNRKNRRKFITVKLRNAQHKIDNIIIEEGWGNKSTTNTEFSPGEEIEIVELGNVDAKCSLFLFSIFWKFWRFWGHQSPHFPIYQWGRENLSSRKNIYPFQSDFLPIPKTACRNDEITRHIIK